ncbi:osmc family peroxiredoxin [Anaeramoeba ignava]|uniref:Osmc family peroxiredoxin n=1 Tax=Anaeramoeba ignava TaxID=1746090 RepID=A0A9Q0LFW1_ANAIG|nr:osmc family peroxiredoxin [Anaeramoeba ignava]
MLSAISVKPKKSFSSLFLRSASKLFPIKVSGVSQQKEPLHIKIQAEKYQFDIDEPKKIGGTETGPSPLHVMLSSLAGCEVVLFRLVARQKKVQIGEVQIEVNGELDPTSFRNPDIFPGFQKIEVEMKLESEADDKTIHEVFELAEKKCPIASIVGTHPKITFTSKWERLSKSKN